MTSTADSILIIGYGNTLRADDAAGCVVAHRLAALALPNVTAHICQQLTPELAETVSQCAHVFFVDASVELPAGEVRWQTVEPSENAPAKMGHHITPPRILDWSRKLFGRAPAATVIAIGAQDLSLGEALSPPVTRAVDIVVRDLSRRLRQSPPSLGLVTPGPIEPEGGAHA